MRLFISIQLSEALRDVICRIQEEYARNGVRGDFTKRENLHLTLAFIGEYSDPDRVLEVMATVPMQPFELRLSGIGAYGDLWWVGLEESDPLKSYVRALCHGLAEAGIPFDRKRFSPHITFVRRAETVKQVAINVKPTGSMVADHASLMRSDRGKNGMIYTELS